MEARGPEYILGARMRRQVELRDQVLARAGRYQEVDNNLRVKEVLVPGPGAHGRAGAAMGREGWPFGWEVVRQDLKALCEVELREGHDRFLLRTALQGVTGKMLQAVGVAIPPSVRPRPLVVPSPAATPVSQV